jgi:hypothetical protein
MLGGADPNPDDQYIDVGNEYPNVGIDPQYFRDPDLQPATQTEKLWRIAGRSGAWARAGIINVAQFTQWMSMNALHYAQLVLTDPNVISAAKKAGKSTGDFVYDNPAVLVAVLPTPLNVLAVATAIVGYMGRDWWRANVGRGGAIGSLKQTKRTTSWQKAVADNERLQLKGIRAQNNKLIRTLKRARIGTSAAKHRMMVQLNADRVQNKILFKTIKNHPTSWRKAVNRRLRTQLKAVKAQNKDIMH